MSRIVVASADPQRLAALQRTLQEAGFSVLGSSDVVSVLRQAGLAGAALVVADAGADSGGTQFSALLSQLGNVPVGTLLLLDRARDGALAADFRAGVVDILEQPLTAPALVARCALLAEELARPPFPAGTPAALAFRRLVAFVQRTRRSGQVLADTGAGGRGTLDFQAGQLVGSQWGGRWGAEAANALIAAADVGSFAFQPTGPAPEEAAAPVPPPPVATPAHAPAPPGTPSMAPGDLPALVATPVSGSTPQRPAPPPRAVVVDDDAALREVATRFLQRAGFQVTQAETGAAGMQRVLAEHPDVVVSDIMMPEVDGWAFLRMVRDDHRVRDLPFVLLSCHDEYMDRLRQVGAGADGYLAKGVKGDALAQAVVNAARRHREPWMLASPGARLEGRLERAGGLNVLRALAWQGATGNLHAKDEFVHVVVGLRQGRLSGVTAQAGGIVREGDDALRAYVMLRSAAFVFEPREQPWGTGSMDMDVVLDAACVAANAADETVRDQAIVQGGALRVEPGLLALYQRVVDGVPANVLQALASGATPAATMEQTGESPLVVEWVIKDLLRKGVAVFARPGEAVGGLPAAPVTDAGPTSAWDSGPIEEFER